MQTPNQAVNAEILSGFDGAICLKCSGDEGFMKKGQEERKIIRIVQFVKAKVSLAKNSDKYKKHNYLKSLNFEKSALDRLALIASCAAFAGI